MPWSYPPGELINLSSAGQSFVRGAAAAKDGTGGSQATLLQVNINTAAASAVLTLYNGVSTTGTKCATIDCSSSSSRSLTFGTRHSNGLYGQLTGGNADVSIVIV